MRLVSFILLITMLVINCTTSKRAIVPAQQTLSDSSPADTTFMRDSCIVRGFFVYCAAEYEVYKVDSSANCYLIYGQRKDRRYELVAHTLETLQGKRVEVGNVYQFNTGDLNYMPGPPSLCVSCIRDNKISTVICGEDSLAGPYNVVSISEIKF